MPKVAPDNNSHNHIATQANDAAKLEALFASIGEGAIATDERGIITRANKIALQILGQTKAGLLGKRFPDVIVAIYENSKPIAIMDRPITRAFISGEAVSERGLYLHTDGRHIPVFITVSPIILDNRPVGAIEVFRDLTEEIEQEKLKSDFISIASHQLRTPLSAIHMYTRMLQEGLGGRLSQQQQDFTKIVLSSVERMNELIDTLLNITRIEAGSLIIRPEIVAMPVLLKDIVTEFMPAAKLKGVRMSTKIDNRIPNFESDPLLLKEVCANLISNAIKYTPEGGKVDVILERRNDDIVCTIRDTGYGIPSRNQKRIFTKFYRADNISDKDVSGTGLGLYLTKLIIDKLEGDIWFDSKEGKGSTFSFALCGRSR